MPALVELLTDTGGTDGITRDGRLVFRDLAVGTTRQILVNGVTSTPEALPTQDGTYTVDVIETAANGDTESATLIYTIDTAVPAAPTAALLDDSGAPADLLSNDVTVSLADVEAGAKVEYLVIGANGPWTIVSGSRFDPGVSTDGTYTVLVRVTDLAGNVSEPTRLTFVRDTAAPATPPLTAIQLTNDTGTAGDNITADERLTITGLAAGETLEYRLDGGAWSSTAPANLPNGEHRVDVRVVDLAGNVSDATGPFVFEILRSEPETPVVRLTRDTGTSANDGLTNAFALTVAAPPTDATVEYSLDDGATWNSTPPDTFADGEHTVQVRYLDANGNPSDPVAEITFTLDTVAPAAVVAALGRITASATGGRSDVTLDIDGLETGALVEYSIDDGSTWSATALNGLTDGTYAIQARQTDAAGNISIIDELTVVVPARAVDVTPFIVREMSEFGGTDMSGLF